MYAGCAALALKCAVYRLLGWKIGSRVRIGLSYLDALNVTIGDGVRIGHFNVVRSVKRLSIGPNTVIANFNAFFGTTYGPDFPGIVDIGAEVSWMSHHFVDAAGNLQVSSQAVIAGRDTHFWTHEAQPFESGLRLMATRVEIGSGAYVGARATLLGCSVPPGAVVGAGSVVTKDFAPEPARLLIAGNPATIRKRYPAQAIPFVETAEAWETAGSGGDSVCTPFVDAVVDAEAGAL